jgi:hypothetical protein
MAGSKCTSNVAVSPCRAAQSAAPRWRQTKYTDISVANPPIPSNKVNTLLIGTSSRSAPLLVLNLRISGGTGGGGIALSRVPIVPWRLLPKARRDKDKHLG